MSGRTSKNNNGFDDIFGFSSGKGKSSGVIGAIYDIKKDCAIAELRMKAINPILSDPNALSMMLLTDGGSGGDFGKFMFMNSLMQNSNGNNCGNENNFGSFRPQQNSSNFASSEVAKALNEIKTSIANDMSNLNTKMFEVGTEVSNIKNITQNYGTRINDLEAKHNFVHNALDVIATKMENIKKSTDNSVDIAKLMDQVSGKLSSLSEQLKRVEQVAENAQGIAQHTAASIRSNTLNNVSSFIQDHNTNRPPLQRIKEVYTSNELPPRAEDIPINNRAY